VQPGDPPQQCYEQAGALALQTGCLVIAAAGNESQRPGLVSPVDSPANASTIMAVASVGQGLGVSYFSNGGKIDIAGPGENVYSTVPMPVRYDSGSGTSMAAPHVAGCAALHAEANSNLRGPALWKRLQDGAQKLSASPGDIGAGLVQSP
jgi:subtilisin family serine protease